MWAVKLGGWEEAYGFSGYLVVTSSVGPMRLGMFLGRVCRFGGKMHRVMLCAAGEGCRSFTMGQLAGRGVGCVVRPIKGSGVGLFFNEGRYVGTVHFLIARPLGGLSPRRSFVLKTVLKCSVYTRYGHCYRHGMRWSRFRMILGMMMGKYLGGFRTSFFAFCIGRLFVCFITLLTWALGVEECKWEEGRGSKAGK